MVPMRHMGNENEKKGPGADAAENAVLTRVEAIQPISAEADEEVANELGQLHEVGRMIVEGLKNHGEHTVAVEKTKLESLKVQAEARVGERAHEQKLAESDERLKARREWTIRVLGVIGVLGFFGFVTAALYRDKLGDPASTMSTMALVIGFLYLLVKNQIKTGSGGGEDDK
jgi:hypothetical protein